MTKMLRRKAVTGYPRGEETKERIVNVAVKLFGEKGFDGVSTRELAAVAAVPTPSLQYYFGNKQELYAACMDLTQDLVWRSCGPIIDATKPLLLTETPPVGPLINAYCAFIEKMMDALIGVNGPHQYGLFILRHYLPSDGNARSFSSSSHVVLKIEEWCTCVIEKISRGRLNSQRALTVSTAIYGQIIGIYTYHHRLFGNEEDQISPLGHVAVKEIIRNHTRAILALYHDGIHFHMKRSRSANDLAIGNDFTSNG